MSVREELQEIYDRVGELVPRDVLRYVRNAPQHFPAIFSSIEWDDEAAAEEYRVRQVMGLIRSVKITIVDAESSTQVRQWHSLPTPGGNAYKPIREIKEDPFQRELLLRKAEREWLALYQRYQHLEEFLAVVIETVDGNRKAS